jgi:hypothetical protein
MHVPRCPGKVNSSAPLYLHLFGTITPIPQNDKMSYRVDYSDTSQKGDISTYVKFENKCPFHVKVYWHDYDSSLVEYDDLGPGKVHQTKTYVTHPWSARDSNTEVSQLIDNKAVFYPRKTRQPERVFITSSQGMC